MPRTVFQLSQDIIRECRGQASNLEARQSLQDALNIIDAMGNWEFLIATRLINIHEPYSTGTVSCSSGSATVTLSGGSIPTTVSPFGEYREIKFAGRELPYKIASVAAPSLGTQAITLTTNLSGTTASDIVSGTYVIYQARYPLPTDCEPGRDLALKGPVNVGLGANGNLPKRQRLLWERRSTPQFRAAGIPSYYTDDEYDDTNKSGTIRIEPYPTRTYEFRLTYYRKLTVPTTPSESLIIPEAFERAPIALAASGIMRKKNIQGWMQLRQEGGDLLQRMYGRYACSPAYEGKIHYQGDDTDDDDTFGMDSVLYTRGV